MNKKLYFHSLVVAMLIFVVFHVAVDLVRFNITRQCICNAIMAKEAEQYNENYTVIAYVIENDNGSTIYVYIQSALTNRYRRYLRFDNVGNELLNGGVLTVIGANNFFTQSTGSVYGITLRDNTFWQQEPLGEYILQIQLLRQYSFSFWLFSGTIAFVLCVGKVVYMLLVRVKNGIDIFASRR